MTGLYALRGLKTPGLRDGRIICRTHSRAAAPAQFVRPANATHLLIRAVKPSLAIPRALVQTVSEARKAAVAARGIAAESPQDLHKQIRGLAAESPVFCGAKNAPEDGRFPICMDCSGR
jgi:hypothetical protein